MSLLFPDGIPDIVGGRGRPPLFAGFAIAARGGAAPAPVRGASPADESARSLSACVPAQAGRAQNGPRFALPLPFLLRVLLALPCRLPLMPTDYPRLETRACSGGLK